MKRRLACLLVGLAFAAAFFYVRSCARGMCGNEVLQREISPDLSRRAYAFTRSCGAMDSTSWQVAIVDAELDNESGNVMAMRSSQSGAPRIVWKDNTTLLVSYPQHSEVHRRADVVDGVRILYDEQPLKRWNAAPSFAPEQSR